jgi:hypothetical protein
MTKLQRLYDEQHEISRLENQGVNGFHESLAMRGVLPR